MAIGRMMKLWLLKKTDFEAFAEDFSATRSSIWPELEFLAKDISAGDKILDAGCGNGRNIPFFLAQKAHVTGLDISAKLIQIAQKGYQHCTFARGKLESLPFPLGSFDAVFAIASLHHLPTRKMRRRAFEEAIRVLKPGGLFAGTVWNLHQERFDGVRKKARSRAKLLPWWSEDDLLIPWGNAEIPRFYHAFSPDSLRNILESAGYIDIELFGVENDRRTSPEQGKNICFRARKPKRIAVTGVPFDMPNFGTALAKLHEFANGEKPVFVTTPNPEMCVEANKNPRFKTILRKADFAVADGMGILWAADFLLSGKKSWLLSLLNFFMNRKSRFFPERISGSDLFREFCKTSKVPIFLLGGAPGVAEKCAGIFTNQGANIVGTDSGSANANDAERILEKIKTSEAKVLFVAFGSPKQEIWIDRNLEKLPTIRLLMGIGGSFDFVAGTQIRAPQLFRKFGIEWLWRLIREPSRFKRIKTAVWTFPKLAARERAK